MSNTNLTDIIVTFVPYYPTPRMTHLLKHIIREQVNYKKIAEFMKEDENNA